MMKTLHAIHAKTASFQPQYLTMDTTLTVGDILQFSYFVHDQSSNHAGYLSALIPEGREVTGHFLVSDLFVCTLSDPPCVYAELTALDPHFRMLYPVERVMLLQESELLSYLHKPITH